MSRKNIVFTQFNFNNLAEKKPFLRLANTFNTLSSLEKDCGNI